MIINQQAIDKKKVKEKCVNKIAAAKEKLAREMQMKVIRERDEHQVMSLFRIYPRYIKSGF